MFIPLASVKPSGPWSIQCVGLDSTWIPEPVLFDSESAAREAASVLHYGEGKSCKVVRPDGTSYVWPRGG